jgi:formylglycine-generating enzyme required for sulfatase activity
MNTKSIHYFFLLALFAVLFTSCRKEQSSSTGWNYNDSSNGGFQKVPFEEQMTGPGLILIEGGTFTMGQIEQDVMYDWDNIPRRVSVSSFYMDETEVTNFHWLEYVYWLNRIYGADYPEVYRKALPDTLVWRDKLAYNEPYVDYYFRHPAYRDYPVVGVNWLQANDYCSWRTDRVNELILIQNGLFEHFTNQINEEHFTTESYFAGQYQTGKKVEGVQDLHPDREYRDIRMEDGLLLPKYRLPTEAEWEFAAYALLGNTYDELIFERRIYPWNGHWVRNPQSNFVGDFMANFVRGRGDYMGVAGSLNDAGDVTTPVYAFWPNDYGLYHMAGNVSEWVMDVYRPLTHESATEFRPFRGNVFQTKVLNSEGDIEDKYDIVIYDIDGISQFLADFQEAPNARYVDKPRFTEDEVQLLEEITPLIEEASELQGNKKIDEANERVQDIVDMIRMTDGLDIAPWLLKGIEDHIKHNPGDLRMRNVTMEENMNRRNYRHADNIRYKDGDEESSIYFETPDNAYGDLMYNSDGKTWMNDLTTRISDRSRVFKGASWKDRAYNMHPGTRRHLNEKQSTSYIGFRCAMVRVGSPMGMGKAHQKSERKRQKQQGRRMR